MTAAPPYTGFGPDDEEPADAQVRADLIRAVRLAAKCFEIARSTNFSGEREAAISRGIAIAEKAGLRLDLFDIPGRDRSEFDLRMALQDAAATHDRWADALRAGDDESIYDAKRRAFDEATRAAAGRDQASGRRTAGAPDLESIRRVDLLDRWPSPEAAINALRARRVDVHPAEDLARPGEEAWFVPARGLKTFDEWQLRELADEVVR